MKARPLGRKAVVVGDRVRVVGDVSGGRREPGPHRRGRRPQHGAAPQRGRRRRRRAGPRGERRPARHRQRPRRPRAAHRVDRPRAGGGVRRRDEAAALPHQVGPGRPRDAAGDLPAASGCRGWSPTRAATCRSCATGWRAAPACSSVTAASGKSTLVNALVPDADREIGHVNAVTGRGRHTSTSAIMLPLPGGPRVTAGGSSTPRASGRSASRTCSRSTSSRRSRTSTR